MPALTRVVGLTLFMAAAAMNASIAEADSITVTPLDNTQANANAIVDSLLGAGITRSGDATLIGVNGQQGNFSTSGGSVVGFSTGAILTSGLAADAVGPSSNFANNSLGVPGDPSIPDSFDANSLTFNFTVAPTVNNAAFRYAFASEEYNQFVGSSFNDAFGFYINGHNVALIPSTNTPVSINTVNAGNGTTAPSNPSYFRPNSTGTSNDATYPSQNVNVAYDGLTVPLIANVDAFLIKDGVTPNTIKLVIADRGDSQFDSAVFLQAGSFTSDGVAVTPEPGAYAMLSALGLLSGGVWKQRRRRKSTAV